MIRRCWLWMSPPYGLDPQAHRLLLAELRRPASAGTAILMATHRLNALIPEIKRCVLLRDGTLAGDGSLAEVLSGDRLSDLLQHVTSGVLLQRILAGASCMLNAAALGRRRVPCLP